jgi:hypothetical protein
MVPVGEEQLGSRQLNAFSLAGFHLFAELLVSLAATLSTRTVRHLNQDLVAGASCIGLRARLLIAGVRLVAPRANLIL